MANWWQDDWNRCRNSPYYRLRPILGDWKSSYREKRREEVILSRLRTGSCYYLIQHNWGGNLRQDRCEQCRANKSVEHVIMDCPQWDNHRNSMRHHCIRNGIRFSLHNVLGDEFDHKLLFKYLGEIGMLTKI